MGLRGIMPSLQSLGLNSKWIFAGCVWNFAFSPTQSYSEKKRLVRKAVCKGISPVS